MSVRPPERVAGRGHTALVKAWASDTQDGAGHLRAGTGGSGEAELIFGYTAKSSAGGHFRDGKGTRIPGREEGGTGLNEL